MKNIAVYLLILVHYTVNAQVKFIGEIEKLNPKFFSLSSLFTIVVFPDPEGAAMTINFDLFIKEYLKCFL